MLACHIFFVILSLLLIVVISAQDVCMNINQQRKHRICGNSDTRKHNVGNYLLCKRDGLYRLEMHFNGNVSVADSGYTLSSQTKSFGKSKIVLISRYNPSTTMKIN